MCCKNLAIHHTQRSLDFIQHSKWLKVLIITNSHWTAKSPRTWGFLIHSHHMLSNQQTSGQNHGYYLLVTSNLFISIYNKRRQLALLSYCFFTVTLAIQIDFQQCLSKGRSDERKMPRLNNACQGTEGCYFEYLWPEEKTLVIQGRLRRGLGWPWLLQIADWPPKNLSIENLNFRIAWLVASFNFFLALPSATPSSVSQNCPCGHLNFVRKNKKILQKTPSPTKSFRLVL